MRKAVRRPIWIAVLEKPHTRRLDRSDIAYLRKSCTELYPGNIKGLEIIAVQQGTLVYCGIVPRGVYKTPKVFRCLVAGKSINSKCQLYSILKRPSDVPGIHYIKPCTACAEQRGLALRHLLELILLMKLSLSGQIRRMSLANNANPANAMEKPNSSNVTLHSIPLKIAAAAAVLLTGILLVPAFAGNLSRPALEQVRGASVNEQTGHSVNRAENQLEILSRLFDHLPAEVTALEYRPSQISITGLPVHMRREFLKDFPELAIRHESNSELTLERSTTLRPPSIERHIAGGTRLLIHWLEKTQAKFSLDSSILNIQYEGTGPQIWDLLSHISGAGGAIQSIEISRPLENRKFILRLTMSPPGEGELYSLRSMRNRYHLIAKVPGYLEELPVSPVATVAAATASSASINHEEAAPLAAQEICRVNIGGEVIRMGVIDGYEGYFSLRHEIDREIEAMDIASAVWTMRTIEQR